MIDDRDHHQDHVLHQVTVVVLGHARYHLLKEGVEDVVEEIALILLHHHDVVVPPLTMITAAAADVGHPVEVDHHRLLDEEVHLNDRGLPYAHNKNSNPDTSNGTTPSNQIV